jgi:nucleotide-binding universal stress UspA family protein
LFPARFSKIPVAVDGSEKSLYAAKYAIVLARKDDAEVIALTVAILPAPNYLGPSLIEEWRNHAMIEAELLFDKIRTFVIENSKSNNGKQTKFKTELLESQLSAWALHLPGDRILRRLFYLGLSHQSNLFCFSLIP